MLWKGAFMIRSTLTALAIGLLVAPAGAQGPALPTVDQILAKHIEASGGRAALERVTSIVASGTLSVPDAGVSGSIELYAKAPNRMAAYVDIGGMQQAEAYDGAVAWSNDPQNGLRIKAGAELADARTSAMFNKELRMKELYPTMTVVGREPAGSGDAWVVVATPAEGTPIRMYFAVDTWLLVRQIVTRETPMGPLEVDVTLDDYRVVDGVKRAFTIRQSTSMFSAVIQLTEIKHNPAIDDAVFKKPGL